MITLGRHPNMNSDLDALEGIYTNYGFDVMRIPSKTTDSVFHADVACWTPFGLIKCNMGKQSRVWEPDAWFSYVGVNPVLAPSGAYKFEGADLLWVNQSTALIGYGKRTNKLGAYYVAGWLQENGVSITVMGLPSWHNQHLFGVANVIKGEVWGLLGTGLPHIIPHKEYLTKGPNWVDLHNGAVVLSDACRDTVRALKRQGVHIITTPCQRLLEHGGGPRCATGYTSHLPAMI